MSASAFADLSHLLATHAVAPIRAQQAFDAQWHEDSSRWLEIVKPFVEQCPQEWSSAMRASLALTAPVRQVLQRFELDCLVRVRIDRERSVSVRVSPLELGWQKISAQSQTSACRVALTIEAVPLPAAPSATVGLPLDADPLLPG